MRGPSRPQVWDSALPAGRWQRWAGELPGLDALPSVPSRTRGCRVVPAASAARGSGLRSGLQSPAWPPTYSVLSCVPGAPLIA